VIRALVMAGGRSERMRASLGPRHKGLVPVLGVPLLERNVRALLCAGFQDIVVAVSAEEPELAAFVETRCTALADAVGAKLGCFLESPALGTIGAAQAVLGDMETLLVLNVDNLSALDLRAFVEFHVRSEADMSVAVHRQAFRLPFGEAILHGRRLERISEKPVKRYVVSSGTYVLGRQACGALPPGQPCGAPSLVEILRTRRQRVHAFRHDSPWIDVNERAALQRAEAMVFAHRDSFELWRGRASRTEVLRLLYSTDGVSVLRGERTASTGDGAASHGARTTERLRGNITEVVPPRSRRPAGEYVFDEPDEAGRTVTRYRLLLDPIRQDGSTSGMREGRRLHDSSDPGTARALAIARFVLRARTEGPGVGGPPVPALEPSWPA
jgi:NDP-mannose synthase